MKKILTLILSGASFAVLAQNKALPDAVLQENATAICREMTENLKLNEQEYIQIRTLTLEKLRMEIEIRDNYAYDTRLLQFKLKEIADTYQAQVRNALNTRQVEHYLADNKFRSHL